MFELIGKDVHAIALFAAPAAVLGSWKQVNRSRRA
jgi:hypothetical protein